MKKIGLFIAAVTLLILTVYFAVPLISAEKPDNKPVNPLASLPFSPAVVSNGFIFVSGNLGINPSTGKMAGDDIGSQTSQALENIKAILQEHGADIDDVVKTSVFLASIDDYKAMNKAYASFFGATKPARSTVAVSGLVFGALVEIEAIAAIPSE